MDETLIERLYGLIGPSHSSDLRKVMLAQIGGPETFIQTFTDAMQEWVSSTATSCILNCNIMVNAWHKNGGMTKLWRHLKTYASYGYFLDKPIPNTKLRDSALIVITDQERINKPT